MDNNGKTLLKCFGANGVGELGKGHNIENKNAKYTIDSFPKISSIHCGGQHSFIITSKNYLLIVIFLFFIY